ncbi:MAG: GNVR domain-containing protein [Gemmatimonadales bacterium]
MDAVDTRSGGNRPTPPAILSGTGRVEGPREETSLLGFLSIVLAHRRLIALFAFAGMLLFGILAASEANKFLSRASFIVKGSRPPALIPGGVGGLGLSLAAAAEFSTSIIFYSDLVRAKTILVPVARKSYATVDSRGLKAPLAAVFGIKEKNPDVAAALAADQLFRDVSSSIYSRSGVVGIAVQATDPLVAQQIAQNIFTELDAFSRTRRHEQTAQERKFIEGLVDDARVRLARAEQAVSNFLAVNRDYEQSPQLRLENGRLMRDVMMQQQIYTALGQSLEQAKIEESRDPTALSVVEPADLPAEPERREALRKTLLGLAVGLLVGIAAAFVRQRASEVREARTSGFTRYADSVSEASADLPPLLRPSPATSET